MSERLLVSMLLGMAGLNAFGALSPARAQAPATLQVRPDRVSYLTSQGRQMLPPQRIQLSTTGPRTTWSATTSDPWIGISPRDGVTPGTLIVSIDTTGLEPGHHAGRVVVGSGNAGSQTIAVDVTIATIRPIPQVAPKAAPAQPDKPSSSVTPQADNDALALTSTTLAPATLNLSYSQPIPVRGGRPPYVIRLVDGQLPPDLALIEGVVRGIARLPGTYTFSVSVADGSVPAVTIVQTLTLPVIILSPATALMLDPQTMSLVVASGATSAPAALKISSGGPALAWRVTTETPWLRALPANGTAPGTTTIQVDAKGLAAGTFSGTLTVTMDGTPNSPVRVPVELVVKR